MSNEIQKAKKADPLHETIKWIVAGNSEPDVLGAIAENFPDEKARPLILRAVKELARLGDPDKEVMKGFVIEGVRNVLQKALEVGDHQTALRALDQLWKIAKQ